MKFEKARKGTTECGLVFKELTASILADLIEQWSRSEAKALSEHGEELRIYDVEEENSKIYHFYTSSTS